MQNAIFAVIAFQFLLLLICIVTQRRNRLWQPMAANLLLLAATGIAEWSALEADREYRHVVEDMQARDTANAMERAQAVGFLAHARARMEADCR
jgi:hypothetical protein